MPELAAKLKERNVQNAIFYRISDTNGFIMFARKMQDICGRNMK